MKHIRFKHPVVQGVLTAATVVVIAFATGFVLQESEILGASPKLPGRVPLEAVANGDADVAFTAGTMIVTH